MLALVGLGMEAQATLQLVAPPMAEALIATAMGLFVAIPAIVFYNRFSSQIEKLENSYANFMEEFSTILHRQASAAAASATSSAQSSQQSRAAQGVQPASVGARGVQ